MPECAEKGCIRPVFARGLCSRHYDALRRSEAPPCTMEGCSDPQHAGGLCNRHYRATLKERPIKCSVEGCERSALTHGLCDAHRTRLRNTGHLDPTRPHDWGGRSAHPLYETWKWLRRQEPGGHTCQEWLDDFWRFVRELGDKPSPEHVLRKRDRAKPHAEGNSYWAKKLISPVETTDRREYMRIWHKQYRSNNPEKYKDSELRRRQRITLQQFNDMVEAQQNRCAICGKAETALHRITQSPRAMAVDHCHRTGKIRGLLCSACNTGIGNFKDDAALLEAAIAYIRRHE